MRTPSSDAFKPVRVSQDGDDNLAVEPVSVEAELVRQLNVLVSLGYPALTALSAEELRTRVLALAEPLGRLHLEPISESTLPFVVVVASELTPAAPLVPLLRLAGGTKSGIVDRNHGSTGLSDYRPINDLALPLGGIYAIVNVQRGEEFCGVRPEDAFAVILGRERTPLTIHEGIAVVTQFAGLLEKNKCFMLSGSRRHDRRVPAMWISERAPKLGWCWDGNPHSWLGVASTQARVGSVVGGGAAGVA